MIMTKQTHDEHERINSQSFDKIVNKTMFEQGYAKALNDVEKIVDELNSCGSFTKRNFPMILKQEIAKLSHNMPGTDFALNKRLTSQKGGLTPPLGVIPKLAKLAKEKKA